MTRNWRVVWLRASWVEGDEGPQTYAVGRTELPNGWQRLSATSARRNGHHERHAKKGA